MGGDKRGESERKRVEEIDKGGRNGGVGPNQTSVGSR